jgi:hypothetical protein
VRVVSGVDGQPVVGAAVSIGGARLDSDTDAKGEVFPDAYSGAFKGAEIDVDAPGFLPRRTRIPLDRLVTLWPVADDTEAEAVREMVYQRGNPLGDVLHPPDSRAFLISFVGPTDLENGGSSAADSWAAEAAAFGSRFGITYALSESFQYEQNEIAIRFAESGGCETIPAWGFCRESPYYKSFRVLPEKARDPQTIRRVLASWFLDPNPLPGFMNPDAPAADLSPLEDQAIRMIFQRWLPNRWPDTDR